MLNLSIGWILLVIVGGLLVDPYTTGFIFFTSITAVALGNVFNFMGRSFKQFTQDDLGS